MVDYRVRLDTTTTWLVVSSAALITFTLGNPQVPHFVLLLALMLDGVFMLMEAQRYRFYEFIRRRVRLLESGFYVQVLQGQGNDWVEPLREMLQYPKPPIGLLPALAVRVQNNYLGLLTVVSAAWLLKLYLSGQPLFKAAGIGSIPGWVVFAGFGLGYLGLLFLVFSRRLIEED